MWGSFRATRQLSHGIPAAAEGVGRGARTGVKEGMGLGLGLEQALYSQGGTWD